MAFLCSKVAVFYSGFKGTCAFNVATVVPFGSIKVPLKVYGFVALTTVLLVISPLIFEYNGDAFDVSLRQVNDVYVPIQTAIDVKIREVRWNHFGISAVIAFYGNWNFIAKQF